MVELQRRQKWLFLQQNLQTDDVVLVVNNLLPRGQWPLTVVIAAYPDEWGTVHHVTLQNAQGWNFDRPITKCVLLESSADDENAKQKATATLEGSDEQGNGGILTHSARIKHKELPTGP